MSIKSALEALKRQDFTSVRQLLANEDPKNFTIQYFQIKGIAELAQLDWNAAQKTFTAATVRFTDYPAFWLNRAIAEENLGQADAAIASNEHCLILKNTQVEAMGNLANLYRRKKRYADSETMARRALENGMNRGDGLNLLGLALAELGKFDEADTLYREAQQNDPRNATVILNRANILVDKLQFFEAWPMFAAARAIKDEPVFRRDEGMARILSGDYERGWPLYEARLAMPNALRVKPACPLWDGANLAGKKLLIVAEQGFGDVIQFARYQEFIHEAELTWVIPKPLIRLMTSAVRGKIVSEGDALLATDFYVPMMSLPYLTGRLRPESTPLKLQVPETPKLHNPGKHKFKIGLIWAGSQTKERDQERSIPLAQLKPLFDIKADFYAPFLGDALAEIGTLPIERLDRQITDFADTSALLKQMDCVVSVDTAVAHLAGTLGIKTLLLLAHCPDWRWGSRDDKTAWYPSMTLMRQPKTGDWHSVIERVTRQLKHDFQ